MKSRVINVLKKTSIGLLTAVMVVAGSGMTSLVANAATTNGVTSGIVYKDVKYSTCKSYISAGNKVPEYTTITGQTDNYGYLFAGWFKANNDASANKITASTTGIADNTTVYAKFVPAYVMSVKCQNLSTTTASSTSTDIRILSSLDSAMYSEFGFRVEKLTLQSDGSYKETLIGEQKVSKIFAGGIKIYSGSNATTYSAANVFGAKAKYAASLTLTGVTDFKAVYSVQPYWVTFDGTKVYGLARNAHVEDGLNGYINVPVNLKSASAVAAGVVTVDCSALEGYTLDKVERGAAFQEMEYKDTGNNKIKVVGNVADISKNADSNDLFVNLRFKPTGNKVSRTFDDKFYHFDISGVEFCDKDEKTPSGYTVWDIQY